MKKILFVVLYVMGVMQIMQAQNIYVGNHNAVRYVGRTAVSTDGDVSFDWVGTYLETCLTGGKLALSLSERGTSFYNVFVDGELHKVVKACGKDTIIDFVSGVDKRKHHIRIQKRTEGEFGAATIHQFILPKGGGLSPVESKPVRHIEVIGNSLTCGYGVEGVDRNEPFKLETENCNLSFSTIIARYFDADYTLIAHSGRGAVRNYGDSVRVSAVTMKDKMMNSFDECSAEGVNEPWNFETYQPDLVVINLGTNDFSVEPHPYKSEFVRGYQQILKQLREGYGNIPILCLYPCTVRVPVYSYYEEAVENMNDENIFLFELDGRLLNETSDLGAVWHPSYSGHRKMAMEMIPFISTITGWEMPVKVIK